MHLSFRNVNVFFKCIFLQLIEQVSKTQTVLKSSSVTLNVFLALNKTLCSDINYHQPLWYLWANHSKESPSLTLMIYTGAMV